MSKTPKKAAKSATKHPAKKVAAKAKMTAKAPAKMKAAVKAAPARPKPKLVAKNHNPEAHAPQGSRRGFMWKLLEQKQQKLKEKQMNNPAGANAEERLHPQNGADGFSRFNGPRRRVG